MPTNCAFQFGRVQQGLILQQLLLPLRRPCDLAALFFLFFCRILSAPWYERGGENMFMALYCSLLYVISMLVLMVTIVRKVELLKPKVLSTAFYPDQSLEISRFADTHGQIISAPIRFLLDGWRSHCCSQSTFPKKEEKLVNVPSQFSLWLPFPFSHPNMKQYQIQQSAIRTISSQIHTDKS